MQRYLLFLLYYALVLLSPKCLDFGSLDPCWISNKRTPNTYHFTVVTSLLMELDNAVHLFFHFMYYLKPHNGAIDEGAQLFAGDESWGIVHCYYSVRIDIFEAKATTRTQRCRRGEVVVGEDSEQPAIDKALP